MEIIKIENLTKIYKQKRKKIKAVDNLSFSVMKGEILGFLGPNGAGKSTTIKIMMGLIKPTSGKVFINGINVNNPKSRKNLGFLPENPNFIDTLTGKDFLLFSARMHGLNKTEAEKRVNNLFKELSLVEAAERSLKKYSKGMLQKIGFAAAIIHNPDILILDEPMSGLDPIGRYYFKSMFKKLKSEGKTIFFSSHIIPDVEDLCDRVAIINKGKLIGILDMEKIKAFSTTGYEIVFKNGDDLDIQCDILKDNLKKINVDASMLLVTIEKLKNKNIEIISINPVKKDLETVFVELIANKENNTS